MLIEAMTAQECWTMLGRNNLARLACARDNQPYVVPVRVDLDGEFLYGYATLGRKIEWMRTNPLVCLEYEEVTSPRQWGSLVVFGRYEELSPTPDHQSARQVAERLFQKHPMWWEPATVPLGGDARRTPIVFRIHVDSVTGRRTTHEAAPEHRRGPTESKPPHWLTRMWRRRRRSSSSS
jgi:nitroimidazol reductase NimA-like FMN-containing flavoprotein (pyridoxamine 5'-phosphate oxidase superfamily)